MRLLHVVPSFGLGGMEKIICAVIKNTLDCHAHDILALDQLTHASKWINDKKIRFVDFRKPDERRQFFQALYRVLHKTEPDLLMTYNWGATDAIWLGRLAGIRRIIHNEHGFNVDEGKTTNWKRDAARCLFYRLASKVIVVSRELESLLQRRYLLTVGHVTRISNGIDAFYYSPNSRDRNRTRSQLGFAETDVVIGFSGRLDPVKNLDRLLDIFAVCLRQHSHLRLLVVGDGLERKRLENLCREKNIYDHIVFTGQQDNVLPYLRAMDVVLLTSLREQMPMTVLEAMAVGIPVVATKVGEIPNIIDHGVNGFVLDADSPFEPFVEVLFALLCPVRRRSMGDAARQKIVGHFQEHAMVEQYKTLIKELE
jgi:glycosyltransferase involved in cell wall biosynthesis